MIYDCFLYNGEKECLQIRCEELKELDVTHVLIESSFTFSGKSNALKYWDFANLYSYNVKPFLCNNVPNNGNAWDNEKTQRNYILTALEILGAKDDDIVIISDADEIPSMKAVKSYNSEMGLTALKMYNFWYKFNFLTEVKKWVAPKIMTYEYLKNTTPNEVRNSGFPSEIEYGGWHFSYAGDADYVINKIKSFSHQEFNTEQYINKKEVERKINNGLSLWGESQFQKVEIDESFPKYLLYNQPKFKHLIA